MPSLQAVFWDVDGTLAETELQGHRLAYNRAFKEFGLDWIWDEDLYTDLLTIPGGRQRMQSYSERLGQRLNDASLDRLRVIKQRHYLDVVASGAVQLRPGVPDLLVELNASGVQQWIVTSSGKASVKALLRSLSTDIKDVFQGMVTADDVEHHKPNPHPYLRALEWSDVSSDHALAVEDSAAGLQSACSARLRCLMTPSAWDQDWQLFSERAQAVVDHLGGEQAPTVHHGPTCAEGRITLEYLQSLLSFPLR
ncbi:HAD-IA family hydrolase [Synechococcus sp. NOUM97013]|uniref:HAD-IA family hydrolase n=1 Tax=Synechococcus sp. NOUM97013 TaxID=1442555 RepID=UPI0016458EFF|nr:HAD-IA family hydrolase [Synechococcus sp. NOUM97013]QNI73447.1 HAD hydrolase/ IA/ variant 3 family protein [Synechococcus sp. NOUM97013]